MSSGATDAKQQAHELIDRMSVRQVIAAVGFFEAMLDPVEISLANAPLEDEEPTPETIAALDRASESLDRREGVSHEEILREFAF